MINGHAIGGGVGLTLACDFRWVAADAMVWIPEVDLGVPLGVASTTRFVRLVGPARAKEIIMEGRRYDGGRGGGRLASSIAWCRGRAGDGGATRTRERLAAKPFAAARRGQGSHQRHRPHGHPRGQRHDRRASSADVKPWNAAIRRAHARRD